MHVTFTSARFRTVLVFHQGVYAQGATTHECVRATTHQNLGCSHRLRECDKYKARENGSSFSSFCEQ